MRANGVQTSGLAGEVLVVEDDEDIREVLGETLELEGYRVTAACNGRDALALLTSRRPPCVIVLDLMMPVMSGWELLERLKRDGKLDDGLHVVVISASPTHVPTGSVVCMRKPVHVDQLIETVRRYC